MPTIYGFRAPVFSGLYLFKMKKLTTEEFIKRAKEVHGDNFDYSQVVYNGSFSKITLTCKKCGYTFDQYATSHLSGCGCKKCAIKEQEITKDEFIKRSKNKYGERFSYDDMEYASYVTPSKIHCTVHGDITIIPKNHLCSKYGCVECANEATSEKLSLTTEEFIQKAKMIHGDKYDYSKVNYTNKENEVTIICPKHGEFSERAGDHLRGHGCRACGREKTFLTQPDKIRLTKEEFIEKARAKHGDKYDYSLVEYVDTNHPVKIICPVHGVFEQTPYCHLRGSNCQKCNETHMEEQCRLFLENNGIKYIYQKKFKWLKRQSLDFYLPDYSLSIECQGKQHYEPVDFSGEGNEWAAEEFQKTKKRDKKKYNRCKENGLDIVYIRYDEPIDESLNKILHDRLNKTGT